MSGFAVDVATGEDGRGADPGISVEVTAGSELQGLFGLAGLTALVTDSGGTGSAEVAHLLAAVGARVVIADTVGPATTLAEAIVADGGLAEAVPTAIEDEASVVDLLAHIRSRHGSLDILVNCAGMSANQPLIETTAAVWDEVHSLNLRANFLCMREAVKLMVERGTPGRIVNVTTIGAMSPVLHGNEAYSSARAGVTMLGRTTALDYAPQGIRANTVMVGSVPGKVRWHPNTARELNEGRALAGPIMNGPGRLPLGRGGMRDVAAAVLFLVSPASAYMTGQSIILDGGFLLT